MPGVQTGRGGYVEKHNHPYKSSIPCTLRTGEAASAPGKMETILTYVGLEGCRSHWTRV
jgi:hypothetical protein